MKLSAKKIKACHNYTIEELAEIFSVSAATIRNHLKPISEAVIPGRPVLVIGRLLKAHLEAEQGKRKAKKPSANFYCPSCKTQVRPYGDMVDGLSSKAGQQVTLKAFCPQCEGGISKFASQSQLKAIEQDLGSKISIAS